MFPNFHLNIMKKKSSDKQKDQIINNYNVKVNITKKKTKNISIANLTLNNANHYEHNKNKSDLSDIKNANSVLNSPKRSYNKIISKLKNEFREITNKSNNAESKEENEDDLVKLRIDRRIGKQFAQIKPNFTSVNHSVEKTTKITKSKSQIKLKSKNKHYRINKFSFSLFNKNSEHKLLAYDLENEKEKHLITKQKLNDANRAIIMLKAFIASQEKAFIEYYNQNCSKILKKKQNEIITLKEEQINKLIKDNKLLKNTILKLLYVLEMNHNDIINTYNNKIYNIVSQVIKENEYLREILNDIDYKKIDLIKETNHKNNNIEMKELFSKTTKESTNISEINQQQKHLDLFSSYMKNSRLLEKTIKKDGNNTKSNSTILNKQKTVIYPSYTQSNLIKPKHRLRYSKVKN